MPPRPWILGLALIPLLLALSPATQPPETKPDWIIKVEPGTQLLGWDEDGRGMYLLSRVKRVNLWAVGFYYWPEGVGGVVGLLALRWLVRDWRRKRVAGEEYCRGCNYMLRGLLAGRCPECGAELSGKNRVAGGGRRWRLLAEVMVLAAVGVGYGVGRDRLPRVGRVGEWVQWRSEGLADWAEAGGHGWLMRQAREQDEVMVADSRGERGMRRVCWVELPKSEFVLWGTLSTHGRDLFCTLTDSDHTRLSQVVRVDLTSGKIIRRFTLPEPLTTIERVVVDSMSPKTLFVISSNDATAAWDVESGRYLGQALSSAETGGPTRPLGLLGNRVVLQEYGNVGPTRLLLWDAQSGQIASSLSLGNCFADYDAGRAFIIRPNNALVRLEVYEMGTGRKVDELDLGDEKTAQWADVRGDTALIHGPLFGSNTLGVFSWKEHRNLGKLYCKNQGEWRISADGKTVSLLVDNWNLSEIRIYRLEHLRPQDGN